MGSCPCQAAFQDHQAAAALCHQELRAPRALLRNAPMSDTDQAALWVSIFISVKHCAVAEASGTKEELC